MCPAKILNVSLVGRAKAFGEEAVERFSDSILGREEEHPFRSAVEENDGQLVVDGDDRYLIKQEGEKS
jgi:hypothetical protein